MHGKKGERFPDNADDAMKLVMAESRLSAAQWAAVRQFLPIAKSTTTIIGENGGGAASTKTQTGTPGTKGPEFLYDH